MNNSYLYFLGQVCLTTVLPECYSPIRSITTIAKVQDKTAVPDTATAQGKIDLAIIAKRRKKLCDKGEPIMIPYL